jgi:hypothetical protein
VTGRHFADSEAAPERDTRTFQVARAGLFRQDTAVSQLDNPDYLLKQAERAKALAKTATDHLIRKTLLDTASEYEERALAIKANQQPRS